MNILKQIYEIYEYLFYRTYIWQLRLWGEKRSPEVAGLLLPTSLFTFDFCWPNSWSITFIGSTKQ